MMGTGSQEDPELMIGTQSEPSSCLRIGSSDTCLSVSSSNSCEPDRKGKGVVGLLLLVEVTVSISGFVVVLWLVFLSSSVDCIFGEKFFLGGFDSAKRLSFSPNNPLWF